MDIVLKLFNKELINHIINYTKLTNKSKLLFLIKKINLVKVEKIQIYKYCAQQIIFGIFCLSEINDLFTTKDYVFSYPNKEKGLSRNKFKELHSKLVIDEDEFVNLLNKSFQSHVKLGSHSLSTFYLF